MGCFLANQASRNKTCLDGSAARAHVLKAAAESVWHETFVQVLMLLHTVAEVESFCGSTVSGRDSTARGS